MHCGGVGRGRGGLRRCVYGHLRLALEWKEEKRWMMTCLGVPLPARPVRPPAPGRILGAERPHVVVQKLQPLPLPGPRSHGGTTWYQTEAFVIKLGRSLVSNGGGVRLVK